MKFVKDTLGNLGGGEEFSDEAFDAVFHSFDKDNSGTVEKSEMAIFIQQLLGKVEIVFSPTPEKKEQVRELEKVEVVEDWEEKVDLVSCPHCSRTFLPDRLKIHLKSCKADRPLKMRMKAEKRSQKMQPKQMTQRIQRPESSTDNRENRFNMLSVEQPPEKRKKSVHFPKDPVVMIEDIQQLDEDDNDSFLRNEKELQKSPQENDFKAEREQFKEAMKSSNKPKPNLGQVKSKLNDLQMQECPHCNRTFKKQAAEKHIPLCASGKTRPKPPPTKESIAAKENLRRQKHLNRAGSPGLMIHKQKSGDADEPSSSEKVQTRDDPDDEAEFITQGHQ